METRLLEIAQEMFLAQGPRMVTMDDISVRAGVSKKTLYQFFSSKEELIERVHRNIFYYIKFLVKEVQSLKENPIKELFMIQDGIFDFLKSDDEVFMHQLLVYFPNIYHKMKDEIFEEMRSCVVCNIYRGIQEGWYEKVIAPEEIVNFYLAVNLSIKEGSLYKNIKDKNVKQLERDCLIFYINSMVNDKGKKILNKIIKQKNV